MCPQQDQAFDEFTAYLPKQALATRTLKGKSEEKIRRPCHFLKSKNPSCFGISEKVNRGQASMLVWKHEWNWEKKWTKETHRSTKNQMKGEPKGQKKPFYSGYKTFQKLQEEYE